MEEVPQSQPSETPPPFVADTVEPLLPPPKKPLISGKTLEFAFIGLILMVGGILWGYVLWGGKKEVATPSSVSVTSQLVTIPEKASPSAGAPSNKVNPSKLFGYIKNVGEESGRNFVDIDEAEFLEGEAAVLAAMKDRGCAREACTPNNFYIRNKDQITSRYFVSESVVIRTLQGDGVTLGDNRALKEFSRIFNPALGEDSSINSGGDRSFQKESPYDFSLENGLVTSITQRYIP